MFQIVGGVILGLALLSQVLTSAHGGDDVRTHSVHAPSQENKSLSHTDLSIACSSSHQLPNRTAGLVVLYIVGSVTMVIAILGAYGAHKESKGCLIAVSDMAAPRCDETKVNRMTLKKKGGGGKPPLHTKMRSVTVEASRFRIWHFLFVCRLVSSFPTDWAFRHTLWFDF